MNKNVIALHMLTSAWQGIKTHLKNVSHTTKCDKLFLLANSSFTRVIDIAIVIMFASTHQKAIRSTMLAQVFSRVLIKYHFFHTSFATNTL